MKLILHLGRYRLAAPLLALALILMALPQGVQAAPPCGRAGTPLEAKALAEKGAAHLAEVGTGKAFNDFMSPDGDFMPHDLYIFVFDRQGQMWVNGRYPGLIGSDINNARDAKGRLFLLDAMRRAARDGSAWVEYNWYNPCTGKPMAKSTHVLRAGDYFIGVGAYGKLSV